MTQNSKGCTVNYLNASPLHSPNTPFSMQDASATSYVILLEIFSTITRKSLRILPTYFYTNNSMPPTLFCHLTLFSTSNT